LHFLAGLDGSKENNEACVIQQLIQESDIIENSKNEQTLGAPKESLIRKRKVLTSK